MKKVSGDTEGVEGQSLTIHGAAEAVIRRYGGITIEVVHILRRIRGRDDVNERSRTMRQRPASWLFDFKRRDSARNVIVHM